MSPGFSPSGPWHQGQHHPPAWPQAAGQFAPPPPPRRRGFGPVILAALAVLGAIMLGLIMYSLLSGPDFENDDYVPPPPGNTKPFPDAELSEADSLVSANALYAQQLAVPIRCELSNPEIPVLTASDAEIKAHLDELMACTMRVWDQPFRGTNRFELVRPITNVYSGEVTSPCGTSNGTNAFYCPANEEVYYGRELARELPGQERPRVIDATMAHEFGHAMQARTLILFASMYQQQQTDKATALELNRRLELQADCFAGMYVQAVAQSVGYDQQNLDDIQEAFRLIAGDVQAGRPGDPLALDNHGQGQSRLYWNRVGLSGTDIARCNTFIAPSEHVR